MRKTNKTLITAMVIALPLFLMTGMPAFSQGLGEANTNSAMIDYLDLRAVALNEALRLLSEESGLNFVATEDAAAKNVTLFIQSVSVQDAVNALCKCHGLWFREDETSRVIRIMTLEEYQKDLVVFREELTDVFTLNYPNALDVGVAIRDLYGKRVLLSLGKENEYDDQLELERRFNKLDLLEERGQFSITGQQSRYGSSSYGGYGSTGYGGRYGSSGRYGLGGAGQYGATRTRTGAQQGPEYEAPEADTRLAEAELTPDQAEWAAELAADGITGGEAIEAARQLAEVEAPIYVTVIPRNNKIAVRTGDEEAMKAIGELITRLDVPTPQVLLEVRLLAINLNDNFTSIFNLSWQTNSNSYPKSINVGGGGDPTTATYNGGMLYQYLDSKLNFNFQLLEDEGRLTTLATPLLLVANNEVSKIFVGNEQPIITDVASDTVVPNVGQPVTVVDPEVEFRNVGITLLITPNINSDRTVTLRILQESSELSGEQADIPVGTDNGEILLFPVDVISTRTVTGTVITKDGLTMAVGGLIKEGIQEIDAGVPYLKDIPLLGMLFSNITRERSREELVILIRPYVITTPEDAEIITKKRLEALSIHPYVFGKEDSLETYQPEEVPGMVRPGPSWVSGLKLHQLGIMKVVTPDGVVWWDEREPYEEIEEEDPFAELDAELEEEMADEEIEETPDLEPVEEVTEDGEGNL